MADENGQAAVAEAIKAEEGIQAPVQQPENAQQDATPQDPYDSELAAAEAALKAEAKPGEGEQPAGEAKPDAKPAEQPGAPGKREDAKVPVAAVYKERKARQAAELRAAELQGQVEVLAALVQKPGGEPEPDGAAGEPSQPADELTELYGQQEALAERFDKGEITAVEWKRQERELNEHIDQIKETRRNETAVRTDQTLQEHVVQLVRDYPVLNKLSESQTKALEGLAYEEAKAEGKPIRAGVEGTKQLRERIAKIATRLYGEPPKPTESAKPAEKAQGLSDAAAARDAKLKLAETMPPDVSKMGSAASGATPSEEELLTRMSGLTDDEALALLESVPTVKARIHGQLFGKPG